MQCYSLDITLASPPGSLTFAATEEIEEDIDDFKSEFEDKCVIEARSSIALPSFVYTHDNIILINLPVTANRVSFTGPFDFSTGASASDTSSQRFDGTWIFFDNTVTTALLGGFTFKIPSFTVSNAYVRHVDINYFNPPGVISCTGNQNLCPNSWNDFKGNMDNIATAINSSSPSSVVPNVTKTFNCTNYTYVPPIPNSPTTGDYVIMPIADLINPIPIPPEIPRRDLTKY